MGMMLAVGCGVLAGLAYLAVDGVATALGHGREQGHARQSATAPATTGSAASAPTTAGPARASSLREQEDALAARPMLQLPPSAAQPQPITDATAGPPIRLPRPTNLNELVPTGYPRTAEGAIAQLAAIDAVALKNLSREQATQVYNWAALPGAVRLEEWSPYVGVRAGLRGLNVERADSNVRFSWSLTHAQVKGSLAAGNFVLACVLGEADGSYRSTSRVALADCQRMVWSNGRWRIAPGDQPAYAPMAWPGSADAVRAGWRGIS